MDNRNSKFRKGSGTYKCQSCGKMTRETGHGESDCELCVYCYEVAGEYNGLQDGQMSHEEYTVKVLQLRAQYKHPGVDSDDILEVVPVAAAPAKAKKTGVTYPALRDAVAYIAKKTQGTFNPANLGDMIEMVAELFNVDANDVSEKISAYRDKM